jgi:hypothetical protein
LCDGGQRQTRDERSKRENSSELQSTLFHKSLRKLPGRPSGLPISFNTYAILHIPNAVFHMGYGNRIDRRISVQPLITEK